MLHYEQVFGNVFERRESECCAVLMKHRCKVKGEQVLIVQMDQQLKTKNNQSKQLFCCQCKDKFCWRHCNARKMENSIIFRTNPYS